MIEEITAVPLPTRRRATVRKSIRLTPKTCEAVEAWCARNQVSFSAGLETLALTGLQEPAAEAMIPAVVSSVRLALLHQFNRIAKLWAFAALESGIASREAGVLLRLVIRNMAIAHPDDFLTVLFEPDSAEGEVEGKAWDAYQHMRSRIRIDTVEKLRAPLDALVVSEPETAQEEDAEHGGGEGSETAQ